MLPVYCKIVSLGSHWQWGGRNQQPQVITLEFDMGSYTEKDLSVWILPLKKQINTQPWHWN